MTATVELCTEDLPRLLAAVGSMAPTANDAERIDRLRQLEELKSAICAAQAREAVALDRSQRAEQASHGVPVAQQGRGVAGQVALALRISPARGRRWLGWAKVISSELPNTFAELAAGRVSEWKTMLLARETATLSREHRAAIDRDLAGRLTDWGDGRIGAETRRAAQRLDPLAAVERARHAHAERRVTIRPMPDTMCRLSLELPARDGVAAYAALRRHADSLIGTGEQGTNDDGSLRSRSQVMADIAVQRLTGVATAGDVPVEISLLMTDTSLLAEAGTPGRDEPAHLVGYGAVPAHYARDIALGRPQTPRGRAPRWLRRIYRHPDTGALAAMETHRREFTANQRRFLELRDQTCRTPYCHAPVRHADHVHPRADGGPTSVDNGKGTCVTCNHAKQAPGWRDTVAPDGTITTRTPTGHTYASRLPEPPGAAAARTRPCREPLVVDVLWFPRAA